MIDIQVVNNIYNLLKQEKHIPLSYIQDIEDDDYDSKVSEDIKNELSYLIATDNPNLEHLETLLDN